MQDIGFDSIVSFIILIYSIIAHEVAHGYAAYMLGDTTAKRLGRLTLNPISHVDIVGSIFLPAILFFSGSQVLFGWAKPVPYNPYALRPGRFSESFVAAAGVITNFLIAIVFIAIVKIGIIFNLFSENFVSLCVQIIVINLSLGLFNLFPFPPFDGLRIITSIFPVTGRNILSFIDRYSILFLMVSLFAASYLWSYVYPLVIFFLNFIFQF